MGCCFSGGGEPAPGEPLYPGQGQQPVAPRYDMYGRPLAPPPPPGYAYGVAPPSDTDENMKLGAVAGAAAGMALAGGGLGGGLGGGMFADGGYHLGPKVGF